MEQPQEQPEPSIQTWEEACAISQQWAIDARQAARKRRERMITVLLTLVFILLAVTLALVLLFTDWQV